MTEIGPTIDADVDLIAAFEAGTLPASGFHHREHVRLAWLYLRRHGPHEAERRLLDGLRTVAARAGKPDKFDGPLTRAWLETIAAAQKETKSDSFDDLV